MTTFTYNGTDLSTLGNITLINDYLDLPARRGSNKMIPFKHGTVFNLKYYEERTIAVGIAVLANTLASLETQLNTIRGLFSEQMQKTLAITYEDASVKSALVTVDKALQVNRVNTMARIVVEFTMCEPFFRLSTLIADNTTTINSSPKAMTVTNTGTMEERDATIVIDGPFSSITITNSTNGASVTYTGAIGAAETVTIGTLNGEYFATLSTGSANVIGNVTHSGSSALLPINAGANTLSITSTGGDNTGTVKISFYPPFL
jgi:phage-related protein